MIKNSILAFLILIPFQSIAQIWVKAVEFTETVDHEYVSRLPKLTTTLEEKQEVVDKVNALILERFGLDSFSQNEQDEFRWYEIDFMHELQEDILWISYSGEYYGAYPNYIEEELFFDLNTGDELNNTAIPFQGLFSLHGYLDFLNRHWLPEVQMAFREATECSGSEPYCSYYDITRYTVLGDKISLSLTDDCYPRVISACSPNVDVILPLDSLAPYLNEVGKALLLHQADHWNTRIDRLLYHDSISQRLPTHAYLFGKIDGQYPFSMALSFENSTGAIDGYYYYNRQGKNIQLTGSMQNGKVLLQEFFNDVETGSFEMELSSSYTSDAYYIYHPWEEGMYLSGTWSSPDKNKVYGIEFTEVKFSDRN